MKTILLIEDNEMMRMFLTHYLGKDYEVNSVKIRKRQPIG
jgi:hypothetical protein